MLVKYFTYVFTLLAVSTKVRTYLYNEHAWHIDHMFNTQLLRLAVCYFGGSHSTLDIAILCIGVL